MIPPTACRPRVLIVDRSEESRDVLRTALERRGVDIFEASGAQHGLELAREHHPGVIVLDLEADWPADDGVLEGFDAESRQNNASIVLLGTVRRNGAGVPAGQFVSKPYHYGPLVRRIEKLLGR